MDLLGSYLKDKAEDNIAKHELEQKLGREVSDYEVNSLSAQIEAADTQTANIQTPFTNLQQSPVSPFQTNQGDLIPPAAPPQPMSKGCLFTLIAVLGSIVLLIIWGGAAIFLPEKTYNSLNPFTPRPPAGAFPKTIGDFELNGNYDYDSSYSKIYHGTYFTGSYKKEQKTISYTLLVYSSPQEAQKVLAAKASQYLGGSGQIVEQIPERFAFIRKDAPGATVTLALDKNLVTISGSNKSVTAFENAFPYTAFGISQPRTMRDAAELEDKPVQAITVLQELNQNQQSAIKKYNNQYLFLIGTVAETGDKVFQRQVVVTPTPTPRSSYPRSSKRGKGISTLINALTSTPNNKTTQVTTKTVEDHSPFVIIALPPDSEGQIRTLRCVFTANFTEQIKKLNAGDTIYFRGKINLDSTNPGVSDAKFSELEQ